MRICPATDLYLVDSIDLWIASIYGVILSTIIMAILLAAIIPVLFTPLRSICKYCADNRLPTSIVMLYSNKSESDIIFKDQLDEMMKIDPNIDVKYVLTRQPGWKGLSGHIDGEMIKAQIPDYRDRTFYICGPPGMNLALKKALESLVPESRIKLEDFTGYE